MDFTSLYNTRIRKNAADDHADILAKFRESLQSPQDLTVSVINYYKGLPIIHEARVIDVGPEDLVLTVNPQQAVVIARDRYTLIRSELFTDVIAAHMLSVNERQHRVSLNNLCFVELLAQEREAVRLSLDPPVPATITCEDLVIPGELLDISVHGLAISVESHPPLAHGAEVTLQFALPDQVQEKRLPMTVSARLLSVKGDAAPYRCKFRIILEKSQEQLLLRFNFQRQVEIIRGLKEEVMHR